MAHDPTAEAPAAPGVSFEVERFEWVAGDRLELVGRWSGLRGHRFLRPTLDVEVDGERRRMLATLEHKPWAAQEGEDWIAAFTWRGDPAKFEEAELTVSPELAVALPPAGGAAAPGKGRAKRAAAVDPRPARRPRTAVLEEELGSALAEAQELREQLRAEQTNVKGLETQLDKAREELAAAQKAVEELDALREERDEAAGARDDAEKARDAARAKADEAWTAAKKALAEAEQAQRARDAALERVTAAEEERTALAEARDRAREERNAWMQRARAAAAGRPSATPAATREPEPEPEPPTQPLPAPPAADESEPPSAPAPPPELPSERRTIRIGERPAPARSQPSPLLDLPRWRVVLDAWGPRLVALLALVVLAVIVVVLLAWAL